MSSLWVYTLYLVTTLYNLWPHQTARYGAVNFEWGIDPVWTPICPVQPLLRVCGQQASHVKWPCVLSNLILYEYQPNLYMWSLIILCSGQFQQAVTIHLMQLLMALCGEWSPYAASELPVYSAEVAKCVTSLRSCHNHSCSNIDILLQGRSVTAHCTRWIVPHT